MGLDGTYSSSDGSAPEDNGYTPSKKKAKRTPVKKTPEDNGYTPSKLEPSSLIVIAILLCPLALGDHLQRSQSLSPHRTVKMILSTPIRDLLKFASLLQEMQTPSKAPLQLQALGSGVRSPWLTRNRIVKKTIFYRLHQESLFREQSKQRKTNLNLSSHL
jgi:hypothetical protein